MSTTDIDGLATFAYANGHTPIDWAVLLAKFAIEVRDEVRTARLDDPAAYPGFPCALDDETTARRIVGKLLDAGWTPPGGVPDLSDPTQESA